MNEITPTQIVKWQNEIYKMVFSESYLRMLNNQLVCLFTHASKMYDLESNPCKKVLRMRKSDTRSMTFWTVDEYNAKQRRSDRISLYRPEALSEHRVLK